MNFARVVILGRTRRWKRYVKRPGEAVDTGLFKEKLKALDEIPTVIVVHKYVTTLDTPNDDVLKQVRNFKTRCAWHIRSFNMLCCYNRQNDNVPDGVLSIPKREIVELLGWAKANGEVLMANFKEYNP